MATPVKLTSMKSLSERSSTNTFFWVYQTNVDPWNSSETPQWAPYPDHVSSKIEDAFRRGCEKVFIYEMYRIDLVQFIQQNIDHNDRQRRVRRRNGQNNEESSNELWRCERLSFPLGPASANSTVLDTRYHGLPYITDWLLTFTKGKIKVTFQSIFPALVQGLEQEGRNQSSSVTSEVVKMLNEVRDETLNKREKIKMKKLQICCIRLYTKDYYVFRVVNTALRDDDRSKLHTIGPYCFLLYNYVGQRFNDWFSIPRRFRQLIKPNESQSVVVYRGDHIFRDTIEQYRQAAGKKGKYFKWLPFVSTSLDREVAESFGCNALYSIELERYSSNDQFAILKTNACIEDEQEVLLKPGVRFRVIRIHFDHHFGRYLVHLKIIPSYISNLS